LENKSLNIPDKADISVHRAYPARKVIAALSESLPVILEHKVLHNYEYL
jgi:hypothetical protein